MKANLKNLKKHRIYSEEFKREMVKDFESGLFSVPQLEKLHGISNTSSTHKMKELRARVRELEGIVGRKQISIDYLEKMIDIAKDEFDIDIKKNFSTPRSAGSEQTKER